jgi:hypothetical protein
VERIPPGSLFVVGRTPLGIITEVQELMKMRAAENDWISNGYRDEYDRINAAIAAVEGRRFALLKQRYKEDYFRDAQLNFLQQLGQDRLKDPASVSKALDTIEIFQITNLADNVTHVACSFFPSHLSDNRLDDRAQRNHHSGFGFCPLTFLFCAHAASNKCRYADVPIQEWLFSPISELGENGNGL